MELDLSDLESIRSFSQQILMAESHLELLVNNGGEYYYFTAYTALNTNRN